MEKKLNEFESRVLSVTYAREELQKSYNFLDDEQIKEKIIPMLNLNLAEYSGMPAAGRKVISEDINHSFNSMVAECNEFAVDAVLRFAVNFVLEFNELHELMQKQVKY